MEDQVAKIGGSSGCVVGHHPQVGGRNQDYSGDEQAVEQYGVGGVPAGCRPLRDYPVQGVEERRREAGCDAGDGESVVTFEETADQDASEDGGDHADDLAGGDALTEDHSGHDQHEHRREAQQDGRQGEGEDVHGHGVEGVQTEHRQGAGHEHPQVVGVESEPPSVGDEDDGQHHDRCQGHAGEHDGGAVHSEVGERADEDAGGSPHHA